MASRSAFIRRRTAAGLGALAACVVLANGCTRQVRRESARPVAAGVTAPPGTAAPGVDRLAELCVDAQWLLLGCRTGRYKLPYWVASRTASLDCSLVLRWAIASVDLCGEDLRSGNPELIRLTVGNLAKQMRAALDVMGESTAKDPQAALTGSVLFTMVGPEQVTPAAESLYAEANRDEAKWLTATDARHDQWVVQQARRLAPLLAEPACIAGRERQLRAAAQALQAAPEEARKLRGALRLPAELTAARAAYVQRLTRADAATK